MDGLKVRLETGDGRHVGTFGEQPPWQKLPEVLLWGQRVFTLQSPADGVPKEVASFAKGAHGEQPGEIETPVYREGVLWPLVGQPFVLGDAEKAGG